MAVLFDLEIHTPYRRFFSDSAQAVSLTLADGEICVYANHSLLTAPVVDCVIRIKDANGNWRSAFVSKGIFEVKNKKNVLIVDAAEWPEEIDKERAQKSKERAETELLAARLKFEIANAKEKLRRAECRLKAADFQNPHKVL